jgi:hypothetical protein
MPGVDEQVRDCLDERCGAAHLRIQTCRRKLLNRMLIWDQRHLLHSLCEFEGFYNRHRPHRGIANARPLNPLPRPIVDPHKMDRRNIRRRDRLGDILHEYEHGA